MSLRGRFRGALVGALVGDCLGSYWERQSWMGTHPLHKVKEKIAEQVQQTQSGKAPVISYTDDSAMTLAMARSLVDCNGFDSTDLARKFTEEFFANPQRGYGASVFVVFNKLKMTNYSNVFAPAQEQFNGEGSFGNGAAMRTSPAALLGYRDDQKLVEVTRDSARLTHAHISGVCGALLQSMAVKQALLQPVGTLQPVEFVDSLLEKMSPFEEPEEEHSGSQRESQSSEMDTSTQPTDASTSGPDPSKVQLQYLKGQPTCTSRLQQIRALLLQHDIPSADSVEQLLGHGVLAHEAVPCALYAFLRCSSQSFRELIPFAISLGGDADTIASMAGAVGGAYWGIEGIPEEWVTSCEESKTANMLADSLFDMICKD